VTYENSGCGLETHTALVLYKFLDHTPHSHKSRIELQIHIIYYYRVQVTQVYLSHPANFS